MVWESRRLVQGLVYHRFPRVAHNSVKNLICNVNLYNCINKNIIQNMTKIKSDWHSVAMLPRPGVSKICQ